MAITLQKFNFFKSKFKFVDRRPINRVYSEGKRHFSDIRKEQLVSYLNVSYVTAGMMDLYVRLAAEALKEIEAAERACVDKTLLVSSDEVIAYYIRKKFFTAQIEVDEVIWDELAKLDSIVSELKKKPDWLSKLEEKEILEDLRKVTAQFFSSAEFLRRVGERYERFVDLPEQISCNKILQYGLEMKISAAKFSRILRSDFLPYICSILKTVQVKWSWMDDEEKEVIREKLRVRYEEKVAIAKKRKRERLNIERRNRIYMRLMRGWTR